MSYIIICIQLLFLTNINCYCKALSLFWTVYVFSSCGDWYGPELREIPNRPKSGLVSAGPSRFSLKSHLTCFPFRDS